ncbi:hypothetical protein E3G71_001039 [Mycobacteroides abscessus]|uniref:hypothetical protein n=1 Tax=Mycobacteroides abscessus TaxID=36809 RepID=UPI0018782B19|nr:hypothetical protein [Mycobacteroides abscessus]MBE5488538.1 hypothetical protein [Mycobacteroides abscessus]MBE5518134.1 hypothetical protein [Mycobacteroides abscessus]MBN7310961.1 hypothetical protein [Mycobacteroides abscessus subsp. abscessus]
MNTKKYSVAALAVVAALTLATTACTPATEPVAAPSSSAVPSTGSAVHEYRKAKSEEEKKEMRLHVAAALPHDVDRGYAKAAELDGVPFAFTYGRGCAFVRLPDRSLWSLNGAGGALTRDTAAEKEFGSWPGANPGEGRPCQPTVGIPAADDPATPGPFRWTEGGHQRLRVNGVVYAVPVEIPESGTVLRDAVIHRPAPTLGEVVPGAPN